MSIACLLGLWFWVLFGNRHGDLPICGQCQYAVRGIASLQCPECGTDLRETGIVTAKRRRIPWWFFLICWTAFVPIPLTALSVIAIAIGPKSIVTNHFLTLKSPASKQYMQIYINNSIYGKSNQQILEGWSKVHVNIEGNRDKPCSVQIALPTMAYDGHKMVSMNNWKQINGTADQAAVLSWLKAVGADTTQQSVVDEADELLSIIAAVPKHKFQNVSPLLFYTSGGQTYTDKNPHWGFIVIVVAIDILLLLGGVVLYVLVCIVQRRSRGSLHNVPPMSRTAI